MNKLHHKGHTGSMLADTESDCLHGKILDINDIITYEGETVKDIKKAFEAAVERYVSYCKRRQDAYVYVDNYTFKQRNPDGTVEFTLIEPKEE